MKTTKSFILIFLLFILLSLFIYFLAKSYSSYIFSEISESFVRFHVVANSNSTDDQIIKYKIRDEIMNYISPKLINAHNKDEALQILTSNIEDFNRIASQLLESEHIKYPVHISVGKAYFPTKDYSSFILPEGNYDALKIELGEAKGQNWWCVMFPSICIPQYNDVNLIDNSMSILENTLDSEELSIISNNNKTPDVKIKFKLIELFENM